METRNAFESLESNTAKYETNIQNFQIQDDIIIKSQTQLIRRSRQNSPQEQPSQQLIKKSKQNIPQEQPSQQLIKKSKQNIPQEQPSQQLFRKSKQNIPQQKPSNQLIRKSKQNIQEEEPSQIKWHLRFSEIFAFKDPEVNIEWPKIILWKYMEKEELAEFLKLERKRDIRKRIDENIDNKYPRGITRIIFCELMYSVTKFCKRMNFNLEQSGHVLSNFYLTHKFFISAMERSAEKVYLYFKDFLLCHCLPFPPDSIKVFTHQEAKEIMVYFCKIYLRNLPLIRFLSLPNFALYLDYELEPDLLPKKGKKDKKGKKGKKDKKKGKKGKKGKKK